MRGMRIGVRSAALTCVTFLVCALFTACANDESAGEAPGVDQGSPVPGDFTGSGPGTLLTAVTLPTIDRRLSAVSSVSARVTYVSTSGVDGSQTSVSGTVFAPKGKPPEGGWPVIAYGHPTTGIQAACAPSLSLDLRGTSLVVSSLVKAGYVVALPDYQGLGDSSTYHPYLDATTVGHNMIDAVRAARKIVSAASDRWMGVGVSQGGQASWAANELADTYGQGLALQGTVSITPPSDITGFADAAADGTLSKDQQPLYAFLLASLAKEFPGFDLDDYRSGTAKLQWDVLTACDGPAVGQLPGLLAKLTADDLRPANPEAVDVLRNYLQRSSLPQRPTSAPMLVIYGGADTLIPPVWTDRALQAACRMEDVIDIQLQTDKGHTDVDASAAFPWIDQRFRGEPALNGCDSLLAPVEQPATDDTDVAPGTDAPADAPVDRAESVEGADRPIARPA